jgi:hypothetical protein
MSNTLLRKLVIAKQDGADPRIVLSQILHQKCQSDSRVSTLAFAFWLLATLVFVGSVASLILGDKVANIPVMSMLSSLDDGHLQAVATGCAIVSSALFMTFLRLRQEQTKHTFLLILVMDGSIKDAATLLFGGGGEGGKSGLALEAADAVLGVFT